MLVWEKKSIYFAIGLSLRETSYVLYAHVLMLSNDNGDGNENVILKHKFALF